MDELPSVIEALAYNASGALRSLRTGDQDKFEERIGHLGTVVRLAGVDLTVADSLGEIHARYGKGEYVFPDLYVIVGIVLNSGAEGIRPDLRDEIYLRYDPEKMELVRVG